MFRNTKLRALFVLLMGAVLVFNSCGGSSPKENTATLQPKIFVLAKDFAPGQLEAHYKKHNNEFGNITQEEYINNARLLLNSAPSRDILEKRRSNGDVLHYRVSSSEFAVMTKEGRIRTYFKADYKYWLKQ